MKAPQIIIISLFALTLLTNAIKHGQRRRGTVSFWMALVSVAIQAALLWWGGFFG